jgi:hypothetical protein
MGKWFCSLMRESGDYVVFIDLFVLNAAWSYYKSGRVKEAARVLSAAAEAGKAGIVSISQSQADALEESHPRGAWAGCPRRYGPTDPIRLYILLGLEGSKPEEEMCVLPASMFGPHEQLLCITEELLKEVNLEANQDPF